MTRAILGVSLALILGTACSDDTTGPGSGEPVASITVTPDQPSVMAGQTLQLQATPKTASGKPLSNQPVTWQSDRTDIAAVSATGLVTGMGEGTALVTATSGGKSAGVSVLVLASGPGPVTSVEIDVVQLDLQEGDVQQLIATAKDAEGRVVLGRVVQWTTSASTIASIEPDGRVTAVRVGQATINAKVDGITASAALTVTATYAFDLVYEQSPGVGSNPELFQLDLRDATATPMRMFAPGKAAMQAAVSPDGSRIAFAVPTADATNIFVADRNGDNPVQLTFDEFNDQPTWSNDNRIAFRKWSVNAPAEIWVMSATDGSGAVNITADQEGAAHEPAWSPGAPGRIAYSRVSNGVAHIWTMNPDGSDKYEVTTGEVYDYEPAWSPDGHSIVFGRTGPTIGSEIWLMNAAGSSLIKLTNLPLGQFSPAFSPDGLLVAFTSAHEGTAQVYTVWNDGSKLARRTTGTLGHASPAWIYR